MTLSYAATPITRVKTLTTERLGIRLLLKREDMNHPFVSGNKWWKLKYNLLQAKKEGHNTLLTFGGAYSNHLYATAAAAYYTGLKSIGIVRGARSLPLSNTLRFAQDVGMSLHFVSRTTYRKKTDPVFIDELRARFNRFYLIPEGGSNMPAIRGCHEFAKNLYNETPCNYLCVPVGTGGTLAGLISAGGKATIVGFAALKGGDFLKDEVSRWVAASPTTWSIKTHYHFGGYGKIPPELTFFIAKFESQHGVLLDPVYTGKMMYGIFDLLQANFFARGSRIVVIHTGGLQGGYSFPLKTSCNTAVNLSKGLTCMPAFSA